MNNIQKQRDEGFTIIEVVLVLAIAALIMLMVFIALPALQRNQRDTARQNDISRLQSALNNYKSRNRGRLPDATNSAYTQFFNSDLRVNGEDFADPSGEDYVPAIHVTGSLEQHKADGVDSNAVHIYPGARCNGEDVVGSLSGSSRRAAIVKSFEGGGYHCTEV